MSRERLLILLHGDVVGVLEQSDVPGASSLTYEVGHVAVSGAVLSASLPLQRSTYPPARVMPYLRGLLPESRPTLLTWGDRLGTDPDDVLAMLAFMGWDCPGAVQFCRESDLDQLRARAGEYEEVDEEYIANRLRSLGNRPGSWSMTQEHWSLGGQQDKFALALIDGHWHEARGSAATTHIFKPGISHLSSQAMVEHATMSAARALGVDAAHPSGGLLSGTAQAPRAEI